MEPGRPSLPRCRSIGLCFLLLALLDFLLPAHRALSAEGSPIFAIKSFTVEGNTLLPEKTVQDTLRPYEGPKKTSQDVEKARAALEKVYHDKGYPAVLVNIPEQTVKDGKVLLQVIESKIGKVRVTGNRYFTAEKILSDLPSLAPGKILYIPAVQQELERINRGKDIKVSPVLSPGEEPGTTDVELKVEDNLPLHGNLELNNRSTLHTTDLRLNTMLRYDNLWQMDHSLSVQYQTSPQDTGQVKMYSASYTLPAPWMADHQIALYGVRSDSNTAVFGEGLLINGKGSIFGVRYVVPLAPYGPYAHNITLGLDYKDFQDTTGFTTGAAGFTTPVTYVPLSVSYNSSVGDSWGMTRFSSGLNVLFRGLLSNQEEFQTARYQSRGNYLYMTAGVERDLKLPADFSIFFKVDGQIADQPLIFHEEYIAGGMMSVRGYKEASALGDDALHGTAELSAPDLVPLLHLGTRFKVTPFLFYDYVWLNQLDPLQSYIHNLQSTGVGLRGGVYKNFYYEIDLAYPLAETTAASKYQERWFFKAGVQF